MFRPRAFSKQSDLSDSHCRRCRGFDLKQPLPTTTALWHKWPRGREAEKRPCSFLSEYAANSRFPQCKRIHIVIRGWIRSTLLWRQPSSREASSSLLKWCNSLKTPLMDTYHHCAFFCCHAKRQICDSRNKDLEPRQAKASVTKRAQDLSQG